MLRAVRVSGEGGEGSWALTTVSDLSIKKQSLTSQKTMNTLHYPDKHNTDEGRIESGPGNTSLNRLGRQVSSDRLSTIGFSLVDSRSLFSPLIWETVV